MAKHWCKEHQVDFFKKGKMKGFAHLIKDKEGEPTGKWCNEPEEVTEDEIFPDENDESQSHPKSVKPEWKDNTTSIETQVAVKVVGELLVGKIVTLDSPLGQGLVRWCLIRLGGMLPLPPSTNKQSTPVASKDKPPGDSPVKVETIPTIEQVIADLKILHDEAIWTKPETNDLLRKLKAKEGKTFTAMIQSLQTPEYKVFAQEVKQALPKKSLVETAKELGAVEE